MQKTLILVGIGLIVIGALWPWIIKLPLGRLPGDIVINKPNVKVFFPITTMIVLSLLISLVLWIFRR